MTVETHLHRARDRVENERERTAAKRDALADFADNIEGLSTAAVNRQEMASVTGTVAAGGGTDRREAVRTSFAETVAPHVEDATNPLDAVRAELGDGVALALAPTTGAAFTASVRDQIRSAANARRMELGVAVDVIDSERACLDRAIERVETVVDWVTMVDETPLSALGFEPLQARHERLDEYRTALATLAADRQDHLHATTSHDGAVGVDHQSLVTAMYADFDVDYPVLSTVARLFAVLAECQRAVRAHLVRRV